MAKMDDDSGAVAADELKEAPAAGSITCPHCGAPVKHVPPPAPEMDDEAAEGGGDEMGDAVAAPVPPAEGMDEGGGDADALEELDELAELSEPSTGAETPATKETLDAVEAAEPETPTPTSKSLAGVKMPPVKPKAKAAPPAAASAAPPVAMDDEGADNSASLREEVNALKTALAETQKVLKRQQTNERHALAEKLLDIGLRSGRLTKKLIGTSAQPGWAWNEAHRSPRAFKEWLKAAPKLWDPSVRGTTKTDSGPKGATTASRIESLAFAEIKRAKDERGENLSYAQACRIVFSDNPNLSAQYDREMSGAFPREVRVVSAKSNLQ